ncbi:MAG: exodeoxyribonuclease VII small subunit [Bacteroidales bacterium]|nr:exodeoxyribonuclease VII small subunit [Bacteroidales bacterium]
MAKKKLSYKEAVEEIEKIMSKLENEEIDIDELSKNVKRAGELITFCKQQLRTTEEEIEHILGEMNE